MHDKPLFPINNNDYDFFTHVYPHTNFVILALVFPIWGFWLLTKSEQISTRNGCHITYLPELSNPSFHFPKSDLGLPIVFSISLVFPSMANPPLKAVTLTHVRYTKGDRLGLFLAWISLLPVFIVFGGFAAHFIFRRELQSVFFAVGMIVSQFINELIKTSVQQARPATCALLETCDSHGWPSSHSQFMFFLATYFSLLSSRKARVSRGKRNFVMELVNWSLAVLTMYSRVYLGYHSVAQVFAGALAGIVIGASWFWVVYGVLVDYFTVIEESEFGRMLCIKDTSHIAGVMKFEYDNARAARKMTTDKGE